MDRGRFSSEQSSLQEENSVGSGNSVLMWTFRRKMGRKDERVGVCLWE